MRLPEVATPAAFDVEQLCGVPRKYACAARIGPIDPAEILGDGQITAHQLLQCSQTMIPVIDRLEPVHIQKEDHLQFSAQPIEKLQNGVHVRLDDTFQHDLAGGIPDRERNVFIVHIHSRHI